MPEVGTPPAQALPRKGRAGNVTHHVPRIPLQPKKRFSPSQERSTRCRTYADSRLLANRDTGSL